MYALRFLLLAPLAVSSTLHIRQSAGAQQILQSITNIDTAVQGLITALNGYTGGVNQSLPVFGASLEIHRVNREGYEANMAVPGPLTSSESQMVDQRVNDTVGVSIPAATQILEDKKPLFDAAALSSLMPAVINLLKYDHETFSAVVGEKLSLDGLPGGLAGAGKIEAVLIAASAYYTL